VFPAVVFVATAAGAMMTLVWCEPSRTQPVAATKVGVPPGPGKERASRSQGHPRAVFQRAIERGNLLVAETTLRGEIPRPTLLDLLELTALIAQKDPRRHGRVAARWLRHYLDACDDATIDDVAFAASCLQSLGGPHHGRALTVLRELADAVR
jgi:hypothetical protein